MDYGAAVEISGFSSEQDGFGSVQHRTNVSALPLWKAGGESEHLAYVGGARVSRLLIG